MNDFWCGIKSKYPLCCIIFFCDTYQSLRYGKGKSLERNLWWNWYTGKGYVQCPDCIIEQLDLNTKTA